MSPPGLPPGWPAEVQPPGSPHWERSAMGWLFDQCPADYRGYDVLRHQPLVLARFAATALNAALAAADEGLRTVRAELRDRVAPQTVEAAAAAYERERHRLRGARHAVDLVERALRGERWVPRL
ncbi:MAG: hypothetical protein QOJ03_1330 [Frankiaceae bacterium]|jgi:hypothetical protein|nr:hypothetical protein [Frankiaceae bacterium]